MNEKILDALIQVLQKHANAIRKLKVLNIALLDSLRLSEERNGVPFEEFERRFQEILASAEKRGQDHQNIAKEIEETMDELIALEELAKKPLN